MSRRLVGLITTNIIRRSFSVTKQQTRHTTLFSDSIGDKDKGMAEEPMICADIYSPLGRAPQPKLDGNFETGDLIPQYAWKDRSRNTSDLKELFSKFDQPDTSAEITSRARFLCAKYLGGAWSRATSQQFTIKAITGGMSNLLFLVALSDNVELLGSEPRQALLRIHCQSDLNQLLTESVVFTLLSERALGPKLHGVFPGGRFEQFIPSRPLSCQEVSQARFSKLIAPMLARVHTLDVPITKEPEIISTARNWLNQLRNSPVGNEPIELRITKAKVDKSRVPNTVTCDDLDAELDFVEKFLQCSGSPIVFSHNDLQEGNVLLVEGCEVLEDGRVLHNGQRDETIDPLVLIDFEYSNYNYRGFDLGNHMCEYGFDYAVDEAPFYTIHSELFESTEERRTFAEAYVDEVYKMKNAGDNPHFPSDLVTGDREKDVEKVIEESILFMSLSHIFWVCWSLWNEQDCLVQFDYGSYGRDRLALYYNGKHLLEEFMAKRKN